MKRTIKVGIISLILTFVVLTVFPTTVFAKAYEPRLTAPNGEPYYTREFNAYSKTGYPRPHKESPAVFLPLWLCHLLSGNLVLPGSLSYPVLSHRQIAVLSHHLKTGGWNRPL